ncbi:hypothetical protein N7451_012120 [Penicillium sp. IBT 35674x]|nr:hypothetical protein N7451_012120 [Penicillium sp. IBT 35674x]
MRLTLFMTASKPLRRVRIWNWKGSNVSRLMFTPVSPASIIASSFRCSEIPLVVRQSSRSPALRSLQISCIKGTMSSHGRLPARQPDLVHTLRHEKRRQVDDLWGGQEAGLWREFDPLLRHAVEAPQVTPLCNANAQVVMLALEGVGEGFGEGFRSLEGGTSTEGFGGGRVSRIGRTPNWSGRSLLRMCSAIRS